MKFVYNPDRALQDRVLWFFTNVYSYNERNATVIIEYNNYQNKKVIQTISTTSLSEDMAKIFDTIRKKPDRAEINVVDVFAVVVDSLMAEKDDDAPVLKESME